MFIDTYRDRFGVEPICRALQFAPSRRQPSSEACPVTEPAALDERFSLVVTYYRVRRQPA